MTTVFRLLIGMVALVFLMGSRFSFASDNWYGSSDFYDNKGGGWFWYETIPEKPKEEKPKKIEPPKVVVISSPASAVPAVPAFGSAAWIRDAMPKLLDKATDEPTRENVAAYYYVQRIMKDKAEKFTSVSQEVVLGDPFLDENTRRPISQYGSSAVDKISSIETQKVLKSLAKDTGIWFFFKSTCEFCLLQSPILKELTREYGFRVLPISMDGVALSNGDWPNYVVDQGQSLKITEKTGLDLNFTPSLFLFKGPDKILPITFGITSESEILDRILMQAAAEGWIDKKTYDKTLKQRNDLNFDKVITDELIPVDDTAKILKAVQKRKKEIFQNVNAN